MGRYIICHNKIENYKNLEQLFKYWIQTQKTSKQKLTA